MEKTEVFMHLPETFEIKQKVAGCFCVFEDKVLLLKRHPEKTQGNTWGLPAGKMEVDEHPIQAAIRETHEETGLKINVHNLKPLSNFYIQRESGDILFHVYFVKLNEKPNIELKIDENIEACWASIEDALALPLIAGGHTILSSCERLRKQHFPL